MSVLHPRRVLVSRVRHVVGQTAMALVGAQAVAAAGVMVAGTLARRGRQPHRFPTAEPVPVDVDGDDVTVYTFGNDLYADMLAAIDAAQETVRLETFIWKADDVGTRFKEACIRAAERGVQVHLIVDEFANLVVPRSFFSFPASVHFRWHPLLGSLVPSTRNGGRDHRKVLVVDSQVAFLGGYNIGDTYADRWRDTHARFTGPIVADIENSFVERWNARFVGLWRHRRLPELQYDRTRAWSTHLRVYNNSPLLAVYPIRNMYLEAINKASRSISMTMAYFVPDDDLVAAMFAAARRGVDVRIIVPGESNHILADWLSRGFYDELLGDGVRLFLYQRAMVHAKTATIDGVWSTIGTANLDRLSLLGNYEVNVEIMGEAVARRMEEIFEVDLANCVELTVDEWRRRSPVAKLTEGLLAPWRPLV